ncbi:hypothetical protein BH23PLA1_BH23PLA1_00100 [soil metagenome]
MCFEPASVNWPTIEGLGLPRVELCRFGLWKETCTRELFDPGSPGATIFEDGEAIRRASGDPIPSTTIELVRASDWVAENIRDGDVVFMKLNCEGSECDIVEDLLDSGMISRIYNLMIDFDVRKFSSLRSREVRVMQKLLESNQKQAVLAEDVMIGPTHGARIRHWLDALGAAEDLSLEALTRKYRPKMERRFARSGLKKRIKQISHYDAWPYPFKVAYRAVRWPFRRLIGV